MMLGIPSRQEEVRGLKQLKSVMKQYDITKKKTQNTETNFDFKTNLSFICPGIQLK